MTMRSDVRRVSFEHLQLDAEAAALQQLLEAGPENLPAIDTSLSTFANALAEHLLHEHDVIDSAMASQAVAAGYTPDQLRDQLETLRWEWEECLSAWDVGAVKTDWPSYSEQLKSLLLRIRRRIAVESDLIAAQALHAPSTDAA